ncbi:MAG: indole-3-glycerol phosphate synthase TrpC [Kiritimatiellia bacterium]
MSFLDRILESKKREIAACKNRASPAQVEKAAAARKGYRGFEESLNRTGIRIIAEIKRASPSKGDINLNLSPADTAGAYAEGGAAALSVLTEPDFFKGSVADLQEARNSVQLPVLRKDFIIDPYQVYESAAAGADAILLIVRILDNETLHILHSLARNIGLDVLTEVFDMNDARRVAELRATLVGINNRNLADFSTDINHALSISAQLPEEVSIVTASGIHSRSDIELNLRNGIRRFLIGEALVKQTYPAATLKNWTFYHEN